MEVIEMARGARLPWYSLDAGEPLRPHELSQQDIDVCLMCYHSADHCETCRAHLGRKEKMVDLDAVRKMLKLRMKRKDMCTALGVGERPLRRAIRRIQKEDEG